jgi:hypothetical protein
MDVVKVTSPEVAKAADEKLAPVLVQATVRINEYTPKVERFTALGNKLSSGGTKADEEIQAVKDAAFWYTSLRDSSMGSLFQIDLFQSQIRHHYSCHHQTPDCNDLSLHPLLLSDL